MVIEEYIENNPESNLFHYINLYNYTNIKLLYNHIITDVPFLEIEEDKLLSFENKKNYTKGTVSNQLQEYTNKQILIDYINNTNLKYNSNNFFDKFFEYKNEKLQLLDYKNVNINSIAYIGLFPFKENIVKNITKNKTNKINFLIICEVKTNGELYVKAFNEKLLIKILGNKNKEFYNLRFKYNLKNKELMEYLKNLFLELNTYFNISKTFIKNRKILKEIDKLLSNINLKNKDYIYQTSDKINFLFYEKENIVNNNLHEFYKKYFLDKFEIKKRKEDETIVIKYKNSLNNNIANLNLKLLDKNINEIKNSFIVKYQNEFIKLKDFTVIDNNFEKYISIVYIINLIFKRKDIDYLYTAFIIGNDKKYKNYAFNIEDVNFNNKLSEYINLDIKIKDKRKKFEKFLEIVDNLENLEILLEYIKEEEKILKNDFITYNLTYLNYLKKTCKEYIKKIKIENETQKTFWDKLLTYFGKEKKFKVPETIEIDGTIYQINKIIESNIGNKIKLKEDILTLKENYYIDLSMFNEFTLEELIIFYAEAVLKSNKNTLIKDSLKYNNKNIDFVFPVVYGKSNSFIDKIKNYNCITNVIIDKPDEIPVYYLYPIIYHSKNFFLMNVQFTSNHSGYWSTYNNEMVDLSKLLESKITMFLKLNNIYDEEIEIVNFVHKQLNFKENFVKDENLMSIKDFYQKLLS